MVMNLPAYIASREPMTSLNAAAGGEQFAPALDREEPGQFEM